MCWTGNKYDDRYVATKDIKCLKAVIKLGDEKFFRPYYMRSLTPMKYEVGETYRAKINMGIPFGETVDIFDGIHCYVPFMIIEKLNYGGGYKISTPFNKGLLGYSSLFESTPARRATIMECTIPKGTLYYMNKNGEIVTETLIIDKIITD